MLSKFEIGPFSFLFSHFPHTVPSPWDLMLSEFSLFHNFLNSPEKQYLDYKIKNNINMSFQLFLPKGSVTANHLNPVPKSTLSFPEYRPTLLVIRKTALTHLVPKECTD